MAFTRYNYDDLRTKKILQESTGLCRYMLNVPGQGNNPCYMEDPHIRMEKWGANLMKNSINLESDLRGLTRKINRDLIGVNEHASKPSQSKQPKYPVSEVSTDQSRATHPAWMMKDLEQSNWNYLHDNPQEHVNIPFNNNLSTRILEKDHFVPKIPDIQ